MKKSLTERSLSKAESDKAEEIVKDLKGNKKDFVKRYGKDAEAVMYGRAVKLAKQQAENMKNNKLKEMVKNALSKPKVEGKKVDMDKDGDIDSKDYLLKRDQAIKKSKGEMKEGYYGTTNVESHIEALGYDSLEDFFIDNPGAEEALIEWIISIPVFRNKLEDLDLLEEDLDLGHMDNEPHHIKSELYQISKNALDLYDMVSDFENKGEVDFPAWWQSKVTTAKNMMAGVKNYLEFELEEPNIDNNISFIDDSDMLDENEDSNQYQKILDQTRNKLKPLFQPYGDFVIIDASRLKMGDKIASRFRIYANSKGSNWKGLEKFLRNNSDFNVEFVSKQTFDDPKYIEILYKPSSIDSSMMNEYENDPIKEIAKKVVKAIKDSKK